MMTLFFCALILCVTNVWSIPLPFTDPDNLGNWIVYEEMTDEFDGNELNLTKWYNYNPVRLYIHYIHVHQ